MPTFNPCCMERGNEFQRERIFFVCVRSSTGLSLTVVGDAWIVKTCLCTSTSRSRNWGPWWSLPAMSVQKWVCMRKTEIKAPVKLLVKREMYVYYKRLQQINFLTCCSNGITEKMLLKKIDDAVESFYRQGFLPKTLSLPIEFNLNEIKLF